MFVLNAFPSVASSFPSASAHARANVASVLFGNAHCSSSNASTPFRCLAAFPAFPSMTSTHFWLSSNETFVQSISSRAYSSCSVWNRASLNRCCNFSFA